MEKIEPAKLTDNFIESIGKEWMLITVGTPESFNTMTASWGGIGWLWNKPVAFIFIRPERYTFDFIEKQEKITLSFLGNGKQERNIYNLCGSKSGRDINKIKESGLCPFQTEEGGITFEQARLTLECTKIYADDIKESCFLAPGITEQWYGKAGGYHKMFIVEICQAWNHKKI